MDIYFKKDYGKLYEKIEEGKAEVFKYSDSNGKVHHMFIKRKVPFLIKGKVYYDLTTPYGYGGPLIIENKKGSKDQLVKNFEQAFQKYCFENNIVSEFVRFHPLINNALDFKNCYNIEYIRNTIGTNLKEFEDPFQSEFSKSCRKNVRKALKNGISYKITVSPNNILNFKKIYYSTMERNNASSYYYFGDDYFEQCLNSFGNNIVLVKAIYKGKTIAMGMYFVWDKTIHIHLSGTLNDYLYLSPAYILRYGITVWGKENGYELIHHGGGRTNSPDDGLFKFKKQFGKNTEFPFYIGKKIWNRDVYSKLCNLAGVYEETDFFPSYRSTCVNQV